MKLSQLDQELIKLKNDPQYIDLFEYQTSRQWDETQTFLNQMIDHFKENGNSELYGKLSLIKIKNMRIHGSLNDMISEGILMADSLEKNEKWQLAASIYDQLFTAAMYLGKYEKAIEYGKKTLELAENHQFHTLHIEGLLNAAAFYVMIEEDWCVERILKDIDQMDFFLTDRNKMMIGMVKAILCMHKKQADQAYIQCKEAYEWAEKLKEANGEDESLCFALCLRGSCFMMRHLNVQAEKDLNQAIKLASQKDYQIPLIYSLINISTYFLENGEKKKAAQHLEKARTVAARLQSAYFDALLEKVYFTFYEQTQEWEKAVPALKKASLFNKNICRNKMKLWMPQLEIENMTKQLERYKALYDQIQQVAQIGMSFTETRAIENIGEVLLKEAGKLLKLDFIGVAWIKHAETEYRVFDLSGNSLRENNDVVRYTQRLVQYSIEFRKDLMINDGNFEDYSLRTIVENESQAKLQSLIVNVLKVENEVIGAMTIGSYQVDAYSENDFNAARIIASYLAITLKNSALYHKVCYLSEHDALTGLLTRGVVLKNGEKLFKKNHKKGRETAIIMLDTDHFRQFNARYGHEMGDTVLKKVGEILQKKVGQGNYAGRYGGEQFIAILDNTSHKEVAKVAESIKSELESSLFENGKEKNVKVTLSGGIYICNEYTLNFADAIRFADHALYRAKLLGRNRIMSYSLAR